MSIFLHNTIDGYQVDLSAGMTTNQILQYNGTKITAATASGGDSTPEMWFDINDLASYYKNNGGTFGTVSGSFSVGIEFYVTSSATCTGIKFWWGNASSLTIRCKLWNMDTSSSIDSVDVSVSVAAGLYTATFSGSHTLTAYVRYAVTQWETTGASYTRFNDTHTLIPTVPCLTGEHLILLTPAGYGSGNNIPNSTDNTEKYPVMPIYTVP